MCALCAEITGRRIRGIHYTAYSINSISTHVIEYRIVVLRGD